MMAQTGRILIVDDEPKICQFLEVLLRREGHEVSSVYNATEALRHVQQNALDLVITDLKMPGMDGFELVRQIKASQPNLPIIMITGYATVETAVSALRVGVEDYVTKPFNVEELRRVIGRTLEARGMARENQNLVELLGQVQEQLAHHQTSITQPMPAPAPAIEEQAPPQPAAQSDVLDLKAKEEAAVNELNAMLKRALEMINENLDARASSIMIRTGDELELRVCEGDRVKDLIGTRMTVGKGIAGMVAEKGEAVLVKDATDRAIQPPSQANIYSTPSFLCVPIKHGDNVLGVISVGERSNNEPFYEQDVSFVQAAADQIAPVIHHAVSLYTLQSQCRRALSTVASAYEAKDQYLRRHSERVAAFACALGKACDASPEELEQLRHAARLHDIGKVSVSEHILDKNGELSEEELELMSRHPVMGERMLQGIDFLNPILPIVRHHHEHVDGTGYPDGLQGKKIPKLARILSIADAYEAMTAPRPWRKPLSSKAALKEIHDASGLQFDAKLAKIFCRRIVEPEN
jgi:response regulator RpfG family c-di-GMP phosphodiesterase